MLINESVVNVAKNKPLNWHNVWLSDRSPPVAGIDMMYGKETKKSAVAMLRMMKSSALSG